MTDQPGVWGIDIGQCALKAIRLALIDGKVTATAFDYVEHSKILSQPDADPDQLTREALDKFLSRNTLKGDVVCISVPGQSGLARFVKLPPVEEKKIVDIVRFEAKQQIPFNLDEVVWDYQKIGSGQVTDGFAMETEIGLFAIKRDVIQRAMQHFQDVNVEVQVVQMAPLALCNFVAYDLLNRGVGDEAAPPAEEEEEGPKRPGQRPVVKKNCAVALDIGTDNSNLVITDGERIIWQRPIPLGGNNFTRALTKDLKLTFAKAEHLKRNATKSPDLKKILAALKPVLNDFVGEVQRSLGYFTNTHRDAQIDYLIGLGSAFRLPGLQRFLAEKLQLDVRKLQKFERLEGDEVVTAPQFTENILSFPVAYGLALQGLKQTRLQTNLLPPEIRMERLIRAKKPWAVAAAAALLFGVAGLTLSYALEIRAYNMDKVKQLIDEGQKISKEAQGLEKKFAEQKGKVESEKRNVRSVIAGQDGRLNWIQLEKFINDCLPRPDADLEDINLLYPAAKQSYWETDAQAKEAYKELRTRQASGGGIGTREAPIKSLDHLPQINLTAMDCRYGDLAAIWSRIQDKNTGADLESLRPKGTTNPPEGQGWVIELRGYTYHYNTKRFITETLVENIARKGQMQAAAATPPGTPAPTPAPAPAPTPAPGTPKPPDTPAPATKRHPVIGKVSHVLLLRTKEDKQFDPGTFSLIGQSELPRLVGGGGPGGYGTGEGRDFREGSPVPGPGGTQTQPGAARANWQPLTASVRGPGGTAEGGRSDTFRGDTGRGTISAPPAPESRSGGEAGPPRSDKPSEAEKGKAGGPQLIRTEFIVVFFWKEDISADKNRPGSDTPSATPAPSPVPQPSLPPRP